MEHGRRDHDLEAIGLLDEPVRRRLFDWVVDQDRPVGRGEASAALGITRALAAFHLDKLVAAGLLAAGYQRLSGRVGPGAGRPARVYRRGEREISLAIPERRYERVATLFASALERVGDGSVPGALREAARAGGEALGRETAAADGDPLLAALVAGGYEPATDAGGAVRLRNCPFHALVGEHRSLVCGANLAFAEGIARAVDTDLQPVLDPQPGLCCVTFLPAAAERGEEGGPGHAEPPA